MMIEPLDSFTNLETMNFLSYNFFFIYNNNIKFRRFVVSKYSWNHLMSRSQIWIMSKAVSWKKAVFLRLGMIFTFWHENKKILFGLALLLEMIINLPLAKNRAYFAICKCAGIILNKYEKVKWCFVDLLD